MESLTKKLNFRYDNKIFTHISGGTLLALLLLSALFFRERAWFADIAYQTYLMINEGHLQIMVYRFGAGIVQALPLLGIKMGASIETISLLYSISFTLLYLLFFVVTVWVLQNQYFGLVLTGLLSLIVYDGFYWATSEQQQGLAFLPLFFSYVLKFHRLDNMKNWLIVTIGIIAIVYYHPLIFIPFFFISIFLLMSFPARLNHLKYWAMMGLMALALLVKNLAFKNWYDNAKFGNFFTHLKGYWPNYLDLPSHRLFLQDLISVWYWLLILWILVTIWYIRRKQWSKILLVWIFSLGHLFLLHIGDPESSNRFYAEVNYMALMIYVLVPFAFDWLPCFQSKKWVIFLLTGVFLSRLIIIGWHHQPYAQRIQWIKTTLETHPKSEKIFLNTAELPMDILKMTWGTPYESLLITGSNHPDSVQTLFISTDLEQYQKKINSDSIIFSAFRDWPITNMNEQYFRFSPNHQYKVIQ